MAGERTRLQGLGWGRNEAMGMMMLALVALFALSKSKKPKPVQDVTPALPDMPDEAEEPAPVVRTPGSTAAEATEHPEETVEEVVVTPPSGVEDEPEEDVSPALPDTAPEQEEGPVEVDVPQVPVQDPGGGVTVEEVEPEGEAVDVPSPHEQAIELARYVAAELKAGRGANLGIRGKPSVFVQAAQLGMGMSQADADGIYGPATRAAGQALGVVMPARR